MPVPFFDLTRQYPQIKPEVETAVLSVMQSGRYILGENVSAFEKEMAAFCGTKHAVGLASGTDALHLALAALGIKKGDEVITTPFTFVATAEAISYVGATPVFVDIEPKTFNIAPEKIEAKITKKTKAIIPVHLFGLPAEMDPIMALAQKYDLKVVEDAAQAIGATYNGKIAGTLGDIGCLSFFPTKNLGAFGDGGMALTNDGNLAEKIKMLRNHGSPVQYHHDFIGYNSRLDEIQAAILRIRLKRLQKWTSLRQKNAALYDSVLKFPGVITPYVPENSQHVYHQYTLRAKNRDQLREHLKQKGIGSMVYYPISLHLQKVYSSLFRKGEYPECEKAQEEVLSLPIFPELTPAEIEEVGQAIISFYK